MKVYQRIASLIEAINNCIESNNQEWLEKHRQSLNDIMEGAPSGSGWDNGTKLSDNSKPDKLIFYGSFHHMSETGFYNFRTDHTIVVKPSFAYVIDVRVTGRNRNDIKDYLTELFYCWLDSETDK